MTTRMFSILTLLVGLLSLLATPFIPMATVHAQDSVNFNKLQQSTLKVADASLARLDKLESQVSSNTYLTETTKQAVLDLLNDVEAELLAYKAEVQAATTTAQLQAANQQLLQYLKDNKDVIKQAVQMVVTDLAVQMQIKVQELIVKVEQALAVLKVTCPQEIATINEVEAQLQQLETELTQLGAAIKAKNTATIKKEMAELSALAKALVANLQELEAVCL